MDTGFTFANYGEFRPGRTGLTATGTSQADAAPLLAAVNLFTSVPPGSGALLPQVSASNTLEITVLNRDANALNIYPSPGAQIETLGTNVPFSLPPSQSVLFQCLDPLMAPGRHWTAVLEVGSASPTPPAAIVSPTPPAGVPAGSWWFNPNTNQLCVYYNGSWVPTQGGGAVSITQTVVTLTANTDGVLIAANPSRRSLAVLNIDVGDATLQFNGAAVAGSGWCLPAASGAGGMGGGYDWGSVPPTNAVHAISAAGTRIVVWEGV